MSRDAVRSTPRGDGSPIVADPRLRPFLPSIVVDILFIVFRKCSCGKPEQQNKIKIQKGEIISPKSVCVKSTGSALAASDHLETEKQGIKLLCDFFFSPSSQFTSKQSCAGFKTNQ